MRGDDIAFFARQLGAGEAYRYACFKRRERKRQFLLGRILLRFAVSSLVSSSPDRVGIAERTGAAPQLVLPDYPSLQPRLSLSHSRDWVACVVSSSVGLGIDIEVKDPTRDVLSISQLVFHPNEYLWLCAQPEVARGAAFYSLWSTREALYKLMSSLGRDRIFSPLVGSDGTVAAEPERRQIGDRLPECAAEVRPARLELRQAQPPGLVGVGCQHPRMGQAPFRLAALRRVAVRMVDWRRKAPVGTATPCHILL